MDCFSEESYNIKNSLQLFLKPFLETKPKKIFCAGCGYQGDINALIENGVPHNVIDMADVQGDTLIQIKKDYPNIGQQYHHDLNNRLPVQNNTYDLIIAVRILHHLKNPIGFIVEMSRICRPNGILLIEMVCKTHNTNKITNGHPQQLTTSPEGTIWEVDMMTVYKILKKCFRFVEGKPSFLTGTGKNEERVIFMCRK